MKLTEMNPRWVDAGGPGIFQRNEATGEYEPAPHRKGVGVMFDCPCGRPSEFGGEHGPIFVNVDPPISGGPPLDHAWKRTGDTFETLTLSPSIQRVGGCNWHGFVTNGEISNA